MSSRLGARLETITKFIQENDIVADVGTDHAWLPIELVQKEIARKAYAIDNKKGPIHKAQLNIQASGVSEKVTCILADGLSQLPEDVNVITIAGMGVQSLIHILEKNPIPSSIYRLILQPNYGASNLRRWLSNHGWKIVDESIVLESDFFYEIIVSERGEQILTPLELEYGPFLLKEKGDVFIKRYQILREKMCEALENIPLNSYHKRAKIIHKIEEIKKVLS